MIPGRALHRFAAGVCSAPTLERIVEPAIADVQKEYASAAHLAGRIWILIAGYSAILKVIAICVISVSITRSEERSALVRTVWWASGLVVLTAVLLMLPPLYNRASARLGWSAALTLLPQAAPLAIPIGIAFGIAFGLSVRPAMNIVKVTLLGALVASALSFVILTWAMPAANEAFREITVRELNAAAHDSTVVTLPKGYTEMTFSELEDEIARLRADGQLPLARRYAFSMHLRFALAWATLALVSLLLVVRAETRMARGAFAFAACVLYWVLMFAGDWGSRRGYLMVPLGAWLPNIVLIGTALFIVSSRASRFRGSRIIAQ